MGHQPWVSKDVSDLDKPMLGHDQAAVLASTASSAIICMPLVQGSGHMRRLCLYHVNEYGCLMQDCLSNGKPLLLENIEEELDPMLDPVLEKRYIQQKRGLVLLLGDKEVCVILC